MRMQKQNTQTRNRSRPGFTLLELIVVITIIAVLAALVAGATMRFYGVQQKTNTEVTISKSLPGLGAAMASGHRSSQQGISDKPRRTDSHGHCGGERETKPRLE